MTLISAENVVGFAEQGLAVFAADGAQVMPMQPIPVGESRAPEKHLAWSHGSTHLSCQAGAAVAVIDLKRGATTKLSELPAPAWDPTGRYMLSAFEIRAWAASSDRGQGGHWPHSDEMHTTLKQCSVLTWGKSDVVAMALTKLHLFTVQRIHV